MNDKDIMEGLALRLNSLEISRAGLEQLLIALTASALLLLTFVDCAYAGDRERIRLAKEFMKHSDVSQMMGKVFDGVRNSQMKKLKESVYPGKTPERDEVLLKRVAEYLDKKLTWGNFEEGYAGVYSTFFTEEELKSLVAFYSSPVAKKLQAGDGELKRRLLESTQMQMKDMALSIKKMEKDFIADQKKGERQ